MKNSKITIALLFVVLLTVGCAKTMYVKNGVSQSQIEQDNADCQYDIVKHTPTYDGTGDPIASAIAEVTRKKDILDACYKAKGYHLQTQQEASGLNEQQKVVDARYVKAVAKQNESFAPIGEYIINVCRPLDDKGYIECINEKKKDLLSISVFPDIELRLSNERKEFEQQLLRKDITRKEFKELATKSSNQSVDMINERIKNDIKAGIYTGNKIY